MAYLCTSRNGSGMADQTGGKSGGWPTAKVVIGLPALAARGLIRLYRYTLSSIMGRTCHHLPTCSEYCEEAIARFGLWPGLWIGLARLYRCRPLGTHGVDPVPDVMPPEASWHAPWRYGRWRSTLDPP